MTEGKEFVVGDHSSDEILELEVGKLYLSSNGVIVKIISHNAYPSLLQTLWGTVQTLGGRFSKGSSWSYSITGSWYDRCTEKGVHNLILEVDEYLITEIDAQRKLLPDAQFTQYLKSICSEFYQGVK